MNWKYQHFKTVSSTNDTALKYAPFTIITADIQTNGRGRYGRTWISCAGNLFFSAVLPFEEKTFSTMPFVAALATAEALHPFNVQIKWPNDILLDGKKIAGILLERHDDKLIIGIGINLADAPTTDNLYPAGSLQNKLSAETVKNQLAENLLTYWHLALEHGFELIREKWLQKAAGLNNAIHVRLPKETISGTFIDLSPTGALILQQSDRTLKTIVAGDIFLTKE